MADAPAKAGSPVEALKKKVGPLPLGVWLAAGIGIWWYLRKKQSGAAPGTASTQAGYGTDPAGNTGYIDPQTGYVQGSPEDLAALQSQATASGAAPVDTSGGGASGGGVGSSGDGSTNPSGTSTSTPGVPAPGTPVTGGTPIGKGGWRYPAPTGLAASGVSDSG